MNLLLTLIQNNNRNNNLMPEKESRNYKVIKNLVKTIGSVKFEVMFILPNKLIKKYITTKKQRSL